MPQQCANLVGGSGAERHFVGVLSTFRRGVEDFEAGGFNGLQQAF